MRKRSNSQIERTPFKKASPILVSACLLGVHCRYDGHHALCADLVSVLDSLLFIPFCPEQLGGLSTPRPPADIRGGDGRDVLNGSASVINAEGENVTEAFVRGARESLRLAHMAGSCMGIMKDRSPSCGLQTPHCEKPQGEGIGVTAALFLSQGIKGFEMGSSDVFPAREFFQALQSMQVSGSR